MRHDVYPMLKHWNMNLENKHTRLYQIYEPYRRCTPTPKHTKPSYERILHLGLAYSDIAITHAQIAHGLGLASAQS